MVIFSLCFTEEKKRWGSDSSGTEIVRGALVSVVLDHLG